jgi:branched-chain amino acid aminotransferase
MSTDARGIVFVDGVRRPAGGETISVFDRGFLYGDSVFEVIRTYGGRPFGVDEHVARLHRSAGKTAIDLPFAESTTRAEILRAIDDAGYAESYVRVMITRGSEGALGLDPDLAGAPTRVVIVAPLVLPPAAVYRDGVAVAVISTLRATDGTAAEGAKSSNYLANLLALREAKRRGAYEPLFVVARDAQPLDAAEILEGGTSNVFVVETDRSAPSSIPPRPTLVTPPLGRILGGITRAHVLSAAKAMGLSVREEPITLGRARAADEIFLTSSIREIVPVVRLLDEREHTIGSGRPGPVVRQIHRAFRAHVGAAHAAMPWES